MKVAFIGLGNMGSGIARNIQKAGYDLSVWNRTQSKMDPYVADGARGCKTIREAAEGADVIFTSLMDDKSILASLEGPDGMLAGMKSGAVHICNTTISPECADKLTEIHRDNGGHYASGCVVGRPDAAAAGKLMTILAGDAEAIEVGREICDAFSAKVVPMPGKASQANIFKLAINYSAISSIELMSEVYAFCEKAGVDLKYVANFYDNLYANPIMKMYAAKLVAREFDDGGFAMTGGHKDVSLMVAASAEQGVDFAIGKVLKDKMAEALEDGMEKKDWSAVHEITRKRAGL